MTYKKSLALIGAGYWGKNLARNFHALGALHTLSDHHEARLDSYQEQYPDIAVTSNNRLIFENPEITQVAIAAPAIQHYAIAKEALLAGKDVYVEKPMCMKAEEGKELVTLASRTGKILMVGHLLHYHPCYQKLQELVKSGELGAIHYIASHRLNLGSYRLEENALWNFAPHDISMILGLMGHEVPQNVITTGGAFLTPGIHDTTMTTLDFASGVKAHIYASWLHPFKEQKFIVVGSKAMAVFDDTRPWGEKLQFLPGHVEWTQGRIPQAVQPKAVYVDPPQQEPLREECRHFLDCTTYRKHPRTDGEEGVRVLQVLEAASESLQANGMAVTPGSTTYIHPTATVDAGAVIQSGTTIWHYSHVMGGSKIGPRCRIGQNVFIASGVTLGENVKVQNNVSLYSGVTLEDHVFVGPSVVFTNIENPRSEVPRRDQYLKTHVGRGATLGANATILCGIHIGAYAFIGAGAVVLRDVPPYALLVGNPAKQIGWMSRSGHRLDLPLHSETEITARCPETKELYSLLGTNVTLASEELSPV